jgi:hypothetical protein
MKVPFVFGGTVYQAGGTTPAASVEVAVADAANTLTAYSASNGNLWVATAPSAIDWANAAIVIRNAKGEKAKPPGSPRGANCNASGCHNSARRLLEP